MTEQYSVYKKDVSNLEVLDVYEVLSLFNVTSQPVGHAIKKLLAPGLRSGGKTYAQDIQEAIDSLKRELQMVSRKQSAEKRKAQIGMSIQLHDFPAPAGA